MHPTALRFTTRAAQAGLAVTVLELEESTRTAQEAAAAVGCELGQIIKSVILVDADGPLLVLCAGDRRIDLDRLGNGAEMARGRYVREVTGYAIGGVPPMGHDQPLRTVVDSSLQRFGMVWCAAGTPKSLFGVPLADLLSAIPGHRVADISI
jgi:prolyl-tRNA editing enzyme YbaK/EbsC (Cys-tRNA(Pro) deacylase)